MWPVMFCCQSTHPRKCIFFIKIDEGTRRKIYFYEKKINKLFCLMSTALSGPQFKSPRWCFAVELLDYLENLISLETQPIFLSFLAAMLGPWVKSLYFAEMLLHSGKINLSLKLLKPSAKVCLVASKLLKLFFFSLTNRKHKCRFSTTEKKNSYTAFLWWCLLFRIYKLQFSLKAALRFYLHKSM